MQREMIENEAVEHFLRLNEPAESADRVRSAAEFSEWLTRSPAHVGAFLAVESTWSALDLPAEGGLRSDALVAAARAEPETGNVVALPRAAAPARDLCRKSVIRAWHAAAAAVLLAVGGWLGIAHLKSTNVYGNGGAEVRRVTMPDGSLVILSPNSQVELHWTAAERRTELRQGRARFQVAKNPQRPFLVDTELGTVRAVGTIFDVDAQRQETRITVIEGRVVVESGPQHRVGRGGSAVGTTADSRSSVLQLSAGDRAAISVAESTRPVGAAPSVMAWTGQRVVFRGATLGAVIDEFNRYQGRPVVIDDSGLATLIISGVFDPKNPDSLLSYLRLYEDVQVVRAGDGSVLLFRRSRTQN